MFNKFQFLLFLPFCCFVISANANQCISYKIRPKIVIDIPNYTKNIKSNEKSKDLLHGNVVATLINNYDIVADITPVKDGYCVGLKEIDVLFGYSDFLIKIDDRHKPNTCSYNAILSHEYKHINEYLSVIDDYKPELYKSIYYAADSIIPIFIKDSSDINTTIDKLNNQLQSHPDIILTIQKIHADEEIRNKYIDNDEDYSELKKCL